MILVALVIWMARVLLFIFVFCLRGVQADWLDGKGMFLIHFHVCHLCGCFHVFVSAADLFFVRA